MTRILIVAILAVLPGCGSVRGAIDAARSLGGGMLDDAQGVVDGVSEMDRQRHDNNGSE